MVGNHTRAPTSTQISVVVVMGSYHVQCKWSIQGPSLPTFLFPDMHAHTQTDKLCICLTEVQKEYIQRRIPAKEMKPRKLIYPQRENGAKKIDIHR